MARPDRLLRQLLRRPAIADYLKEEMGRIGGDHAVSDAQGKLLVGDATSLAGESAEILVDARVIGRVHGPRGAALAQLLALLAVQQAESRALARESLDRYEELTMLYSLSEKIIGARDQPAIAAVVCEEASLSMQCDSIAALLLNPETGRMEIAAMSGSPFHDRSTREVGTDILAAVLDSGTGEIVNDLAADPRGLDAAGDLQSIVCSPMKSGERVIGVLVAGRRTAREFTAGDLQILNAMAAHAAAAIDVLRLGRDLKAASRKPVDLIYGVEDRPPIGVSLLMGAQHLLIAVMSLAYPVLITLEAGGTRLQAASVVSMSLIAMAVATVLQVLRRGPIGSGFLAPYITSAIYLGPSLLAARTGGLGLVFGMTILAGVVSIGISQLFRQFRKLFPPEVSGVVVLMVGLSMVPVALTRFIGIGGGDGTSEPREWLTGLVTLTTILLATVLVGRIRLYATAIGLGVGYLCAAALGLFEETTFAHVEGLPLVGLQLPQWGGLALEPLLVIPFVAAALASNVKDAGLVISCQKANDAAWKRPDTRSMSGGLVAGGIGNIASGALGGVGLGISAGSVGLAVATGTTAKMIGLVTAGLFLLLAFLPKATALLALIPSPVMGAGLIYVACHLVASGAELITSRMLDARRIYVVGLPLLAGVGLIALPDIFTGLPPWAETLLASPLAVATILALLLNLMLNVWVSNRAATSLSLEAGFGDALTRFIERQGASWGARGDLISRTIPAVTEWCEDLRQATGASSAVIELHFDEFRLLASIKPDPEGAATLSAPEDASAVPLEQCARVIAQRYDCTAKLASDNAMVLGFEH